MKGVYSIGIYTEMSRLGNKANKKFIASRAVPLKGAVTLEANFNIEGCGVFGFEKFHTKAAELLINNIIVKGQDWIIGSERFVIEDRYKYFTVYICEGENESN